MRNFDGFYFFLICLVVVTVAAVYASRDLFGKPKDPSSAPSYMLKSLAGRALVAAIAMWIFFVWRVIYHLKN